MTLSSSSVHKSTFKQGTTPGCGGKLVVRERGCEAYGQLNREQGSRNRDDEN